MALPKIRFGATLACILVDIIASIGVYVEMLSGNMLI
jgi:hypothetical protein